MSRVEVTQADIMQALIDHNKSVFGLSDSHVFMTTNPLETFIPRGGDFWISVRAGDGVFDQGLMDGGVVEQCMEDCTFTISAHNRIYLDRVDNDTQLILHAAKGLIPLKRKILVSHCGVDLQVNGNEFLRELLAPRSCTAPQVYQPVEEEGIGKLNIGVVSVTFGLAFDWDLQS